ncbi:phage tail sheath subtilisin-like domain-containing protein [Peptococcus simiae]|uniref:Phage tail sheath subtilisin-like domain-containing protein n=1 Tax=Peptococcus simiae TaxID=1643805 RepID=A0ABW9GY50_9FIRM
MSGWGGGLYTVQNKEIPGAYFKFESEPSTPNVFSDRGVVAVAAELDWGAEGKVVTIDRETFLRQSDQLLGYAFTDSELRPWRELFVGANKVLVYRLGKGVKASNKLAEAVYPGTVGNLLAVAIEATGDKFDVVTYLRGQEVDRQTVKAAADLKANAWVTFKSGDLAKAEALPLTGGTSGTATGTDHQKALTAFEGYRFDVLLCASDDKTTKKLYVEWTKQAVREAGLYHQLVAHNLEKADDEYIINLYNTVTDPGAPKHALAWYLAGIEAGCAVNKDLTAHAYLGEYAIDTEGLGASRQKELKAQGRLVFINVDDTPTVFMDINSLHTFSPEHGEDFRYNQCMRVLNQRANDVQKIFTRFYLGKAGTDADSRTMFKNDIVNNMTNGMIAVGAVKNYLPEDTIVDLGQDPRSYHVRERIIPNMAVLYLYQDIYIAREGSAN